MNQELKESLNHEPCNHLERVAHDVYGWLQDIRAGIKLVLEGICRTPETSDSFGTPYIFALTDAVKGVLNSALSSCEECLNDLGKVLNKDEGEA